MQVVMEQRMEVQRVKSGESPLTFECRGWDGTTQPGKQPVCAGAGPQKQKQNIDIFIGQAACLRWARSAARVDVVLGCQRMRCGD